MINILSREKGNVCVLLLVYPVSMDNEDQTKYRRAGMFAVAHIIVLYFFG